MKPNGGNDGIGTLFRCKPGRHFRFVRCDASFHIIVDVKFYENGKVLSTLLPASPNFETMASISSNVISRGTSIFLVMARYRETRLVGPMGWSPVISEEHSLPPWNI